MFEKEHLTAHATLIKSDQNTNDTRDDQEKTGKVELSDVFPEGFGVLSWIQV